jgi:cholesterol oxidase
VSEPDEFDVVVVGSGFGGSVTACRLAEQGRSVLVLERGQPFPPGAFPRTPQEIRRAFWDPDGGSFGMYELWHFQHLDALCASGLGGGSLIYANVTLRKPAGDWSAEGWPLEYADLEDHYARAEAMIEPRPCPAPVPKARALDAAAAALDVPAQRPPLAVRFGEPVGATALCDSVHGPVLRATCRGCGECDVGCNFGAKQTLDFTYLHRAKAAGARIRTCCEVRTVAAQRDRPRFRIGYRQHVAARDGHREDLLDPSRDAERVVWAREALVLAAGAIGTPRLLLANRAGLPRLSRALGTRVSANGDAIAWVRGARNGDGTARVLDPSKGPVITRSLTFPGAFHVQDAGAPVLGDWFWEGLELPTLPRRLRRTVVNRILDRLRGRPPATQVSGAVAAAIGDGPESVLPLLGMGVDAPDGRYALEAGRLELDWRPEPSAAHYDALEAAFRDTAAVLGGELAHFPPRRLNRTTTVHPLGGCPMGRDPHRAAVDPRGRLFGAERLYVADGSAMPGAVGPNPSLTIAAFAERVAETIEADLR